MREITFAKYVDKVRGGWIGKCAGGILGAPIEGYKTFHDITIDDRLFENNFPNDDLDLQILWLDMAKQKGPYIRHNDYRDHWRAHINFPWNEYGIATLNIRKGLDNPDTGRHNNAYWSQSMGSPIRSEIWGMLCPGSPAAAARYARMDSTLDHTDFSVDAEMFFSACAALAFFEADVAAIMQQAAPHTNGGTRFAQLYRDVTQWYERYGEETTKYKIKSKYGDADFTAAPQNVGLTLLALLAFGHSFDNILQSINYGHDSDCIIATAAALIGIIQGYEAIPPVWKERIGNQLMVSPEVSGIAVPETVTQLTDETAAVGVAFAEHFGHTRISKIDVKTHYQFVPPVYHLVSVINRFPNVVSGQAGQLSVSVENLREDPVNVRLRLVSPVFEEEALSFGVAPRSVRDAQVPVAWKPSALAQIRQRAYTAKHFPYTLEVTVDGQTTSFEKGIPFYGSWLLVGPFLADDEALAPMHPQYPDHGLASMPSAAYMNHDRVARAQDFLDGDAIDQLQTDQRDALPFGTERVFPYGHRICPADYFTGRGERTIYLLTTFAGKPDEKKWLCVGVNGYVRVWHNRELTYQSEQLRRSWPMAHHTELTLAEHNELLIRIDYPVDAFDLTVGFREHHGQHPHQSQWDAELIPLI
ncbi:MAG: ADP-ribosylglycohydrolase family protein [Tunicatimonas sp.]